MKPLSVLYDLVGERQQSRIDRVRYAVGALPRVRADRDGLRWPSQFRGCVVISADLELAWAWRLARGVPDPKGFALQKAEATRRNFDRLLQLFEIFQVPVTWATVGHLFLEGCSREEHIPPHVDVRRVTHFKNEFWEHAHGDWFACDPCSDYRSAPAWYAPDLIDAILKSPVQHEIGCHTFSHIPFSEDICSPEVAVSELTKCHDVARQRGITLKTFVFPANLGGNLASLKQCGFSAYRWRGRFELDRPQFDEFGLLRIPGGITWEKPHAWPVDAWNRALRRCVDRAIETGTLLHLWFHPSCERVDVEEVLPALLKYINQRRADLWVTTMAGLVAEVGPNSVS